MAAVDPFSAYVVTAAVIGLIFLVVTLINKFSSGRNGHQKQRDGGQQPAPRVAEGPPGARRRGPRHRMRVRQDGSDVDDDVDEENEVQQPEGKVGAKKLRKLQEKAERRAAREEMEREREDRKKREKELEERLKKLDEIEKKEEAAREEEERKCREEKERQEHEEYLKMKEAFSVDEEGEQEAEADISSGSLLQEFIRYIKESKVVMLEDLAGHFRLKTQDVIQRVQDLQASGDLTGVIDDRGKFIYITIGELEAVAKHVRQLGRVSISELAQSSNRLISLDPQQSTQAAGGDSLMEEMAVA